MNSREGEKACTFLWMLLFCKKKKNFILIKSLDYQLICVHTSKNVGLLGGLFSGLLKIC